MFGDRIPGSLNIHSLSPTQSYHMKRTAVSFVLLLGCMLSAYSQPSAYEQLREDPKKAYGTYYPYLFTTETLTPAPKGYKPVYISLYARHGSRYAWNAKVYQELDALLAEASQKNILTEEGKVFYGRFLNIKEELMTGVSELTQVGWEQQQRNARVMYDRFKELFRDGGNVFAISSMSRRCMLSMSAFCQELVQCNPKIEIREQTSRFTLDGVVPTDDENPYKRDFPKVSPRYEKNMDSFVPDTTQTSKVLARMFTSTASLDGDLEEVAENLVDLYISLPSIGYEGMMDGIVTDEDVVAHWETANLGSYSWVFSGQFQMIPILQDVIKKADAVLDGSIDRKADLRFGHDSCLGPLTVLMGLNGADLDPEDPYEVKNCYQNWQTCKAGNIQLIFYKNLKKGGDVLVKCLLNGSEASLPLETDIFPYYRWSDVRDLYLERCSRF